MKHKNGMYEPDTSLARMDTLAAATLSSKLLIRYEAYKRVLLARERDPAAIVSTLKLFVSDLAEASDRSVVSSPRGNGT